MRFAHWFLLALFIALAFAPALFQRHAPKWNCQPPPFENVCARVWPSDPSEDE